LANRARQFMKVGNWPEAQSLLEAALLLRPDESAILKDAIVTTTQLIPISNQIREAEKVKLTVATCERGLEHLERYLRDAADITSQKQPNHPAHFTLDLINRTGQFLRRRNAQDPAEVQELVRSARNRCFDTLIRIAYSRGKAGIRDRVDHTAWDALAVGYLPEKEKYAAMLRLTEEWRDLPDLSARLLRMTFGELAVVEDSPEYRRFLEHLNASRRPDLRNAAQLIQRRFEWGQQIKLANTPQRPGDVQTKVNSQLERVSLPIGRTLEFVDNCIPTGPGGDIFYRAATLAKLQQPDQLNVFYRYPDSFVIISSVVYDGRYIWMAGKGRNKSLTLLAIDSKGQAIEFSSDDGIPNPDDPQSLLKLAPVAPGKVCLVGYTGRSWAALAEIGDRGTRNFDIFFEAREVATGADKSHETNPKMAFSPTCLFILKNPSNGEIVILAGRHSISNIVSTRPLLIDPLAKTVRVAQFTCGPWDHGGDRKVVQSEDSLFFYENDPNPPGSLNLMRVRWPGNEKEIAITQCPQGLLVFDKRGLHVIGKKWWLADVSKGSVKVIVDSPPWQFRNPLWEPGKDPDADLKIDFAQASELKMVYPTVHYGALVKAGKGTDESDASYFRLKE
jgi:hypothetical protein